MTPADAPDAERAAARAGLAESLDGCAVILRARGFGFAAQRCEAAAALLRAAPGRAEAPASVSDEDVARELEEMWHFGGKRLYATSGEMVVAVRAAEQRAAALSPAPVSVSDEAVARELEKVWVVEPPFPDPGYSPEMRKAWAAVILDLVRNAERAAARAGEGTT